MSDFVSRDILPELWDEIIKRHWAYFDTEESIVKLEKRKKLEDCLKEFLYIVQHNRKFFLTETERVLRNSISDLDDFNAQNAITAFEAISQYANNLFTKPWRKEFRILKMYSGFYQHEIKSNLAGAEKLFEAMGYRRLSDDILILDGPIRPDQVTNVSRDAMIAYVELQIIKHIHKGLDALGINCSWWDIYRYREKHTGGTSHTVKGLANAIEEKRYRSRQKALLGDNYGYIDVQPSANYFANNTEFCPPQCQCGKYQQLPPVVNRHRSMNPPLNGTMCCVPEHQQMARNTENLVYSNMTYPAQQNYHHNHQYADVGGSTLAQMSHSRSLEHYSEPNHQNHHNIVPHRHSFDHQQQGCTANHQHQHQHQHHNQTPLTAQQQQQHYYQHLNHQQTTQNFYESPYDLIDGNSMTGGGSSISYAAVAANAGGSTAASTSIVNGGANFNPNSPYAQPYNVSGNRIPLPLNISNQLSAYDNLQASSSSNYMVAPQDPTYSHIPEQHLYSSVSKLPQNCVLNPAANTFNPNAPLVKDSRQRTYGNEPLIDFEERTPQQQFDPLNQYCNNYEIPIGNHTMDKRYNMTNLMENTLPNANLTSCPQHYISGKQPTINDDMYVYAKPVPRENRKPLQNTINSRKYSYNSTDRGGDTTDLSYESANDDFNNLTGLENQSHHSHSPTQLTKNQDGVGSYESWNYVFKNLERSGYNKDLGEREDFLVESLDLNSININNETSPSQNSTADKRRSNYAGNDNNTKQQQQTSTESKQKSRTLENSKYSTKPNTKTEILASVSSSQKLKTSMDNNLGKKMKSTLKQQPTNTTSTKTNYNNSVTNNINQFNKPNNQTKTNDNKSSSATSTTNKKTMNNNNNNQESSTTIATNSSNGTTIQTKKSSNAITKKSSAINNSTQIIITGDNEWSCSFCTFLNPNTKRICEMCSHTKDFKMPETNSSTSAAASGTNVAHNTTTCA